MWLSSLVSRSARGVMFTYILAGVGALGFAIWDIAGIEFTRANSRTGSAGPNAKRQYSIGFSEISAFFHRD